MSGVELALQGLQKKTSLIYFDDMVFFEKNFDEHMKRVEEVLNRIKQAGLTLKPDKCHLLNRE